MQYRPDLPPAIKGLSFKIKPGTKVGIVGRTGAGKSSIINSLLRIHELTSGSIQIDGLDISSASLAELRCSISIIPQSPYLFQASLRKNLDPFEQHPDSALWQVLERVALSDTISALPRGLDALCV